MKIIDNNDRPRQIFENITIGSVFKYENFYFLKVRPMFLYDDIEDYLTDDNIYDIDELEVNYDIINAICLSDNSHTHFDSHQVIEPLKSELHIVV